MSHEESHEYAVENEKLRLAELAKTDPKAAVRQWQLIFGIPEKTYNEFSTSKFRHGNPEMPVISKPEAYLKYVNASGVLTRPQILKELSRIAGQDLGKFHYIRCRCKRKLVVEVGPADAKFETPVLPCCIQREEDEIHQD